MNAADSAAHAFLLTGLPGSGKTTIIKEALKFFQGNAEGFYTEEIRPGKEREGFKLITLKGETTILAHKDFKGPFRVGKYGVDIDSLNNVGVKALKEAIENKELVVIDEIGKMELLSPYFEEAVWEALRKRKKILGTIIFQSHPRTDIIKRSPGVLILEVNARNRSKVLERVKEFLLK